MSYVHGVIAGIRYQQSHTDHAGGFIKAYEEGQADELAKINAIAGQFKDLESLISWLETRQKHINLLQGREND